MIVLVIMLVRRAGTRRAAYLACAVLVVVVCADRVLLGRHYPSDVTAGALLGAGMVLLGLTGEPTLDDLRAMPSRTKARPSPPDQNSRPSR